MDEQQSNKEFFKQMNSAARDVITALALYDPAVCGGALITLIVGYIKKNGGSKQDVYDLIDTCWDSLQKTGGK